MQKRREGIVIDGLGETSENLQKVRQLIEAENGRVWVESKEGHGTTFNIIFPCATPKIRTGGKQ